MKCAKRVRAGDRQPAQRDPEHDDQDQAEPEIGDRLAEHREAERECDRSRISACRRDHAERHRDHDGEDERHEGKLDGDADALRDQLRHRLVGEQRAAEIARQRLADPVEILVAAAGRDRRGARLRDLRRLRVVAGEQLGEVARQAQQAETDDGHRDRDKRRGDQAIKDEYDHALFLCGMAHTGRVPIDRSPLTFVRVMTSWPSCTN